MLYFRKGGAPLNLPIPTLTATYNDADGAEDMIRAHAHELAAVIVEPMMGGGGCIPAERDFLVALRRACTEHNVILIFDEVMTSRLSTGGYQAMVGVTPDMTTLGKYLGGGMSFGAFGGRVDLMSRFDPDRAGCLAACRHLQQQRAVDGGGPCRPQEAAERAPPSTSSTSKGETLRQAINEVGAASRCRR